MVDQSQKFSQQTLWNTDSGISSQESQAGQKHSDSQDGNPIEKSSRFRPHVSRIQSLGKAKETPTQETFGQKQGESYVSCDLQSVLENRLKALLDLNGSPEYVLKWKKWDMQSGPQICALRASLRRTNDNDCTSGLLGWPTPNTMPDAPNMSENRGDGSRPRITPQSVQGLVGWPTPNTMEGRGGLQSCPDAAMRRMQQGHQLNLDDAVTLTGWATASARDWKDTPGMQTAGVNPDGSERQRLDQLPRQVHGLIPQSSTASTERKGALDPMFSRWLQGYPEAWDSCSPKYDEWRQVQDAIAKAD